ncbi:hypothetical protein KIN20_020135 [Parelaphostrongylus tenuis]|uniref:Uncharacterized protein n=1 Tax=Parelaphostrongylus tenuis TaxID=148309 RepID=A0AAD5MSG7_PARTN|nr:hypothetical protein KIN20_020135 [Parelaphostrongylus tenuis]
MAGSVAYDVFINEDQRRISGGVNAGPEHLRGRKMTAACNFCCCELSAYPSWELDFGERNVYPILTDVAYFLRSRLPGKKDRFSIFGDVVLRAIRQGEEPWQKTWQSRARYYENSSTHFYAFRLPSNCTRGKNEDACTISQIVKLNNGIIKNTNNNNIDVNNRNNNDSSDNSSSILSTFPSSALNTNGDDCTEDFIDVDDSLAEAKNVDTPTTEQILRLMNTGKAEVVEKRM